MESEDWGRSTAYNFIRSSIITAKKRNEQSTIVYLYTFFLYPGEKEILTKLGYTLTWMINTCYISW